jgi:hypothetical protein
MVRVLTISALLLAASVAWAQDNPLRITIIGGGIASCGTWTQARQARAASAPSLEGWIVGFASATNLTASRDLLKGMDYDGVVAWVDQYCRANPLHQVSTAAVQLMEALRVGR